MPCVAGSDCSSGLCYIADPSSFGTCVSYFNGFMDGKETDVDCGGDPDFAPQLLSSVGYFGAAAALTVDRETWYEIYTAALGHEVP